MDSTLRTGFKCKVIDENEEIVIIHNIFYNTHLESNLILDN